MKTIYLCPPWSFDVNYSINPWMEGNFHQVDRLQASSQWNELFNTLRSAGANLKVIAPPPADCPDAVFIANAGLLFKRNFILSRFRFEERAAEEPFFAAQFAPGTSADVSLLHTIDAGTREQVAFEGAGDCLFDRRLNVLWLGFGFRTQLGAKPWIERHIDACAGHEVVLRPLELVDPRFYHLDTCFCPLDTGQLLWYPEAFSDHSRYVIDLWYGERGIPICEEDALNFACNAVSVGKKVILPKISRYTEQLLSERDGLEVLQVDMSQYLRSGGACKCLTLEAVE